MQILLERIMDLVKSVYRGYPEVVNLGGFLALTWFLALK